MRSILVFPSLLASTIHLASALDRTLPAGVEITNNVFDLEVEDSLDLGIPPSSEYLASLRRNYLRKVKRQQKDGIADIEEDLVTLGGRVYMAKVTLGKSVYSLVLDTGSSDTWVGQAGLTCKDPYDNTVPTSACRFGPLYNTSASSSYKAYSPREAFGVNYTSGEYLEGYLATELFGIGDVGAGFAPRQIINQTIGIVEQGYWNGDFVSSGLMGLAYSRLASRSSAIGYEAVMFSLFDQGYYPPVFSLALNRTSSIPGSPARAPGGIMAIGGIPSVPHDASSWVETAIVPVRASIYTYYSIRIEGFDITPPSGAADPVPMQNYTASRQSIIVDSGTTLIYLPDRITAYIASLFSPRATWNPYSGLYTTACDALAPRVGVNIGGETFYISPDDLLNKGVGAVNAGTGGRGQCVLAIQPTMGGASVLGDSWLKNVLVVFDLGGNKVRIAGREVY